MASCVAPGTNQIGAMMIVTVIIDAISFVKESRSMTTGVDLKQSLSSLIAPYSVYLVAYYTKKACP